MAGEESDTGQLRHSARPAMEPDRTEAHSPEVGGWGSKCRAERQFDQQGGPNLLCFRGLHAFATGADVCSLLKYWAGCVRSGADGPWEMSLGPRQDSFRVLRGGGRATNIRCTKRMQRIPRNEKVRPAVARMQGSGVSGATLASSPALRARLGQGYRARCGCGINHGAGGHCR